MYAASSDISDLYGTDKFLAVADRNDDGTADTTAITAALEQATDEINSYLAVVYTIDDVVALSPTPSMLIKCCVDIALYRLAGDGNLTDDIRQRYEDAIAWLKLVVSGKATLPLTSDDAIPSSEVVENDYDDDRVFSRTFLKRVF